jgi:hypothetical protein
MTTVEFLTTEREKVISFFNAEITAHWNISKKEFMNKLVADWVKISKSEAFTKFDLNGNLIKLKSSLGCLDKELGSSYSKPYSESNHAKAVNYYGKKKVNQFSNI